MKKTNEIRVLFCSATCAFKPLSIITPCEESK